MLRIMSRIVKLVILFMLWFDFLLHLAELFGVYFMFFGWFVFSNRQDYSVFWTCYWGFVLVLFNLLLLLDWCRGKVFKRGKP